jgi:hypothetical protein
VKQLLSNYTLLFAMTALTAAAILLKCICAIVYQILLRDSEQIPSTKNKWLRSMHTKFEACYKLQLPIHNPSCFVKSYLEDYHFLGISLKTLENTDFLCALVVTGTTLFSIMCGMYYELDDRFLFIHSMTLVSFLLFLAASEFVFQVRRKRSLLQLQLENYFENTLQAKLEKQYLHPEEQTAYQNAYFTDEAGEKEKEQTPAQENEERPAPANDSTSFFDEHYTSSLSPDMQELIDSLLEESKITGELQQQEEKLHTVATNEKFRLVEEIMKEYL